MKIFCIGRNYAEHAKELNNAVPEKPLVFMKPPSAILRSNKPFYYPDFSSNIHFEVELVLKVCRNGKSISPEFASTYYDQISIGLDLTARDIQSELKKKGHPWEIAKAFDRSAPLGEFIPLSKVPPVTEIEFSLLKNGERVQLGNTKDLLFSFDHLICYLSTYFTLQQGDLIFTGTPAGVGPIAIGDHFEAFIGKEKLLSTKIK